jgi:hypothetical protein
MPHRIIRSLRAVGFTIGCVGLSAMAQAQTSPAPPAAHNVVVEKPTYISVPAEIVVDRPVAEVWKRIGKFCDVAEWLQIARGCTIVSGKDGELGAVRTIGNEVLVGKTEYSFTYAQTVKPTERYNLYHATLEARPLSPRSTKVIYTMFYDSSTLPDDAAREQDKAAKAATLARAVANIKILAEGGTLPAASR